MPGKATKKTTETKKPTAARSAAASPRYTADGGGQAAKKETSGKKTAVQEKVAIPEVEEKCAVAVYKNAPTSPQKARLVADLVRGKDVEEALVILDLTMKKAAKLIKKTLVSAVANAEHDHDMDKDVLVITRIFVDDGIKFRRYRAVARGRGHGYVRRRAHILIELTEKE